MNLMRKKDSVLSQSFFVLQEILCKIYYMTQQFRIKIQETYGMKLNWDERFDGSFSSGFFFHLVGMQHLEELHTNYFYIP